MTVPATTPSSQAPAQLGRTPLKMSYEDYLALDVEAGIAEWVDGEVTTSMPTEIHQIVVAFLIQVLGLFVRAMHLGKVHVAPRPMRARPGGPGREPDVFFVATEHLDRLEEQQLVGPADLAVEVVSDDSVGRDRAEKFYEYEAAGVREYWIVDPRPGRRRADFYVLDDGGKYRPVPIPADGLYRSAVISGLVLRVDRLWQEDPDPIAALAETLAAEKLVAALQARTSAP
ncbi:MAG: Uma2 family endonuclease [Planctomycetes bacterium]|nr:Uma2 family endonuclease [Planctomycetota bacterium]